MKNCKLCKHHKVCNELPAYCIRLNHVAIFVLLSTMGFLIFGGTTA